jgi:hypothetical protein
MTDLKFEDAPGVVVRKAGAGQWEARWQCRYDLVAKGFKPKSRRLWVAAREPSDIERAYVSDQANRLQSEMLVWGRGGLPGATAYDGTLRGLIRCYQTDPDSSFHKLRYQIRENYTSVLKRLETQHGDVLIEDIKARGVLAWHKDWSANGAHIPMAKVFVNMLRTVVSFGAVMLEEPECIRLKAVLSGMRFQMPKPRSVHLTADMAIAIRAWAHKFGWPSVALAQALQFELTLRQKDVIGEWVPVAEPGVSDVTWNGQKWLHGLRWSEIDQNMILRHTTSKTGKDLEVNLKHAPMVLEEIEAMLKRDGDLPKIGPMIIAETTSRPWVTGEFRRRWRTCARAAGIPDSIRNMDTRAGAITEATSSGALLEHVQHAATHSDIGMTQRYSRGAAEKISNVMQLRSQSRNKVTEK